MPESTSTQSRDYNTLRWPIHESASVVPESTSTQSRDYNTPYMMYKTCTILAGININPVAGLQLPEESLNNATGSAGININPVAGLQQRVSDGRSDGLQPESTSTQSRDYNSCSVSTSCRTPAAGININPVAGLQLPVAASIARTASGRNQHQPSRGITTRALGRP